MLGKILRCQKCWFYMFTAYDDIVPKVLTIWTNMQYILQFVDTKINKKIFIIFVT